MIQSLHISNYALIDSVDITFTRGFNVITGETGAGKSIILGALSLLLGGRADTRTVTDPGRKSIIEAEFLLEDSYPLLKQYCNENDIEWDPERCLLRREVSASAGRSRAFVNDSPVSLARLSGVAMHLVDIHSQHQNQLLARPSFQLEVIDSLASNSASLDELHQRYNTYRTAVKRLRAAQARLMHERQDEEYTRYQLEQIASLHLVDGEQEELERSRDIIANITTLKDAIAAVTGALNDDSGAIAMVNDARSYAGDLAELTGDELDNRLESVAIELQDIVRTLTDADDGLDADPQTLQAVEERLGDIYSLQRKHKVETVGQLLEIEDVLRRRINSIDTGDNQIEELKKEARRAKALAIETATAISERRHEAAAVFADELRKIASPLGMKNLDVDIRVSQADLSVAGIDRIDFLFAFNKNSTLTTVDGVASGGEISRLMLCIKSIIASHIMLPSIIFDEIDTGVSGDIAGRMGAMMRDMSTNLQVIAITHLPTVAAKAASHFKVYKYDDDKATHTAVRRLEDNERVDEIALMLSGDPADVHSRSNAKALLGS